MRFYCFMKLEGLFFGIIESAKVNKLVVAVIFKTCILCYFVTKPNKLSKQFI